MENRILQDDKILSKPTQQPKINQVIFCWEPVGQKESVSIKTSIDALSLNEGRAKNDRFSFHNLHHMAATDLARALPLHDLMDYMGWKTPSMALRYMHGDEKAQRAATAAREAQLTLNRQ